MLDTYQQRMMAQAWTTATINESKWFQDIVKGACAPSERRQNKIIVKFRTHEEAEHAVKKAEERNISCLVSSYNSYEQAYSVYIYMNWKEVRPSRAKRNKELVLD